VTFPVSAEDDCLREGQRVCTMAHDVFISYAVEDKPTADAACATLEARGMRCWIAPRDVLPGMDYAQALVEAINQSRVMVLVFSSRSNHSAHVRREVERAVSVGIPILPFRIEDVPLSPSLEYFIGTVHWLDALTPPLEKHLRHLSGTVRLLLSRGRPGEVPAQEELDGPTVLRDAYESAGTWDRHPIVRLAAVLAVVAGAVAAIFVLVTVLSDGGQSESGSAAVSATPTAKPRLGAAGVERSSRVLWDFRTGGGVVSSPAVVDGVVYVGSLDSYVYAVDVATKEQLWRFETGDKVFSSPAVVDGVVYVGSLDNYLYALDAATGQQRWSFVSGGWTSSPAVVDGVVYIGSWNTYIYSLDAATGEERWRFKTGDFVGGTPTVENGVVYVGSTDDHLYALDAATGQERWRFKAGDDVESRPTVVDGLVYIGSKDTYVYAVEAATGQERWRFKTGGHVFSAPAVMGGVVYVGSLDNYLYALDAATGEERWHFEARNDILASPVAVDGVVYVGSGDNYVYALDAATGWESWHFETSGQVRSSPTVVDGVVYVGSDDQYIYALAADAGGEPAIATPSPMPSSTATTTTTPAGPAGATRAARGFELRVWSRGSVGNGS